MPDSGTLPPPSPAPADQRPPDTFERLRALGVVRPDDGRWVAGVASGLAQRWGVDPVLVRGALVALTFGGMGLGVLGYGLGWLLLPQPDGRIHAQEALRGRITVGAIGAVLAVIVGVPLNGSIAGDSSSGGFVGGAGGLVVLALVGWWLLRRHRAGEPVSPSTEPQATGFGAPQSTGYGAPQATGFGAPQATGFGAPQATWSPVPEPGQPQYGQPQYGQPSYGQPGPTVLTAPPAPRPPRQRHPRHAGRPLRLVTLGLALLVGTVTYTVDHRWPVAAGFTLAVLGLGLLASGLRGHHGGALLPIAVVLAVSMAGPVTPNPADQPSGDLTWRPTTAAELAGGYAASVGHLVVDLGDPALQQSLAASAGPGTPAAPGPVPISLGAGQIDLLVPAGTATQVRLDLGAGELVDEITGDRADGARRTFTRTYPATTSPGDAASATPGLTIRVTLTLGNLTIRRASSVAPSSSPSGSPR